MLICWHIIWLIVTLQPKQIKEIKDFLLTARRKDATCKFLCGPMGFLHGC